MTDEMIKALIEAQLNKSGWTVSPDGECHATEQESSES